MVTNQEEPVVVKTVPMEVAVLLTVLLKLLEVKVVKVMMESVLTHHLVEEMED